MKKKFSSIIGILIAGAIAVSCSAPRYASAQSDDNGYNNSQQPPADQQNQQPQDDQGNATTDQNGQYDQSQGDVDFDTFYDDLSPYGTWDNDPSYGQVWICNEPGFVPYYSGGNWAYTDAGWAWNSSYDWGWAPFHYGRWAYNNRWMWVPGYQWAPAWVSWRSGGGYYGWAPLGPGINIGFGFGYGGYIAAERWNFCRAGYLTNRNFSNYCLGRGENYNFIRNTSVINNIGTYRNSRYVAGPDRREVERAGGNRINQVSIRNASRPGATVMNRNGLQMYRPNVRQAGSNLVNRNNSTGQRQGVQPQNNSRQNTAVNRPAQNQGFNNAQRQPVYNNRQQQQNNALNNRNYSQQQPRQQAYQQPNRQQYQAQARPQYQAQQRQMYQQPYRQQQQYRPQYQAQARPQQYQQRPQYQQQYRPQYQAQARPQYQAQARSYGGGGGGYRGGYSGGGGGGYRGGGGGGGYRGGGGGGGYRGGGGGGRAGRR